MNQKNKFQNTKEKGSLLSSIRLNNKRKRNDSMSSDIASASKKHDNKIEPSTSSLRDVKSSGCMVIEETVPTENGTTQTKIILKKRPPDDPMYGPNSKIQYVKGLISQKTVTNDGLLPPSKTFSVLKNLMTKGELNSKPVKKYLPNLSAQRKKNSQITLNNKKEEENIPKVENLKKKKNFIKSEGVFSSGFVRNIKPNLRFSTNEEPKGFLKKSAACNGEISKIKYEDNKDFVFNQNQPVAPDFSFSPVSIGVKLEIKKEDSESSDEMENFYKKDSSFKTGTFIEDLYQEKSVEAKIIHDSYLLEFLKFNSSNDECNSKNNCFLSECPAGKIGSLKAYRSGKVKMIIGDKQFCIFEGQKKSSEEALVSVDLNDTESGKMCHLLKIKSHFKIHPDFEEELKFKKRNAKVS